MLFRRCWPMLVFVSSWRLVRCRWPTGCGTCSEEGHDISSHCCRRLRRGAALLHVQIRHRPVGPARAGCPRVHHPVDAGRLRNRCLLDPRRNRARCRRNAALAPILGLPGSGDDHHLRQAAGCRLCGRPGRVLPAASRIRRHVRRSSPSGRTRGTLHARRLFLVAGEGVMRGCMDCGGKVAPNVRRCRDCVRKKRAEVDYRALALKAYGHDCAYCPKWLNRTRDWFSAARRAQVAFWAVLLYGFRRWPNVQADHILRLASGGSNDLSNLQMLCIRHHARKTRTEGKPIRIRGIRRFRLRHGFAGLELLAAGLLALIRPHHISPVPVLLGGLLAVGILVVLVLSRMRNRVLDRLWNADLIGLPKQPNQQGRQRDYIVPRSRGRGITGSGWHWQRIDGRELPRYQPARLTLRYRGKYLPPEQQAKAVSTVTAMLGRPFRARWDHGNDRAVLEPIPALPEQVDPFAHDGDAGRLIFGQSESGPVAWDVRAAPHCLVVGETGRGKTAAIRVFVDQALTASWDVFIGDVKRIELRSRRNAVSGYETEPSD